MGVDAGPVSGCWILVAGGIDVAGGGRLLMDAIGGEDARVIVRVTVDAGAVSTRWVLLDNSIDVHCSGVGGCTANVAAESKISHDRTQIVWASEGLQYRRPQ